MRTSDLFLMFSLVLNLTSFAGKCYQLLIALFQACDKSTVYSLVQTPLEVGVVNLVYVLLA